MSGSTHESIGPKGIGSAGYTMEPSCSYDRCEWQVPSKRQPRPGTGNRSSPQLCNLSLGNAAPPTWDTFKTCHEEKYRRTASSVHWRQMLSQQREDLEPVASRFMVPARFMWMAANTIEDSSASDHTSHGPGSEQPRFEARQSSKCRFFWSQRPLSHAIGKHLAVAGIVLQPDGKTVVVGEIGSSFAVTRYPRGN